MSVGRLVLAAMDASESALILTQAETVGLRALISFLLGMHIQIIAIQPSTIMSTVSV